MSVINIVVLLVILAIPEGISLGDQGVILRCRCIHLEKKPIGRHIRTVEVNRPNSHCKNEEIIATLKKDGQKVCLDPNVPWVIKVRKLAEQTL
ncbi:interleukin-8-like [Thunnus albacares]|uniref:interleukin-8-like n=1 Tax=Thunnus maccoyii TaxID=8240 RepID=UPI001C4CB246|nr:interleukin-8-like [Thunnus maccoyii]XP_044202739.1 interleukin-8-like [Thunnus albacares]|eukprot:superscaffoldBa00000781_g7179